MRASCVLMVEKLREEKNAGQRGNIRKRERELDILINAVKSYEDKPWPWYQHRRYICGVSCGARLNAVRGYLATRISNLLRSMIYDNSYILSLSKIEYRNRKTE